MSAFAHAESVFLKALREHVPAEALAKGVLLGLSGGVDSMLLLTLLSRLSVKEGVPLLALHVEHGIRGEEAKRDEAFAKEAAEGLGVPFLSVSVNVPAIASLEDKGIEETARRIRYEQLVAAAKERGLGCIFTAHHASDNAETVLLHLARGTGIRGLCGIPAYRLHLGVPLVRPLLGLTGEEVLRAAEEKGIPFVTDSTNADTVYRRNFLRREILTRMREINPSFDMAVSRMCESLAEDNDLLERMADEAYASAVRTGALSREALLSLPTALRCRVFGRAYRAAAPHAESLARVHTDAFFARLALHGDFKLPLPSGLYVTVCADKVTFGENAEEEPTLAPIPLAMGENLLPDGSRILILAKGSCAESTNVYKTAIHRDLSSATIDGGLYVRAKRDGDAYRYGGVTHKLKKLFSDAKIPRSLRSLLPVVCDGAGILWVPYFGVREDGGRKEDRDLTVIYVPKEQ